MGKKGFSSEDVIQISNEIALKDFAQEFQNAMGFEGGMLLAIYISDKAAQTALDYCIEKVVTWFIDKLMNTGRDSLLQFSISDKVINVTVSELGLKNSNVKEVIDKLIEIAREKSINEKKEDPFNSKWLHPDEEL